VVTTICPVLLEDNVPKSDERRLLFTDPRCGFFADFSQTQLAEFLGMSAALVSHRKQQATDAQYREINPDQGNPFILQPSSVEKIRQRLQEQIVARNLSRIRAVKEQIVAQLEIDQPNATPSKS
jgi:hypothetical protein